MASFIYQEEADMAQTRKTSPLTVRCTRCTWEHTGHPAAMLAAQREHRQVHPRTTTEGRPQ
jgi:hypothetical protein